MSEPVTNSEIEDVLSSIRRLISENPSKGEDGDAPAAGADKLVLTPAFRVLDGDGGDESDADAQATQTVTEPPLGEDVSAEMPDDSSADSPNKNDGLEQRIAELEAAIGETYEEWEPDGSEYTEGGEAPTILHPNAEAPAQWDVVPDSAPYGEVGGNVSSMVGIVLEAEEVFDEDDAGADEAEAMAEAGAEDADQNEDQDEDDDFVLDEEMLRELVLQLVREQLKGQIGEKITRSIRRMVRREIRMALAVRDTE